MSAFSLDVAGIGTSFPDQVSAQFIVPFVPEEWVIENMDGTNDLHYSFDGINIHGVLPAAVATTDLSRSHPIRNKAQKLWVKAAAGTVTARVNAYST
jgi:hypothetical protein